MKGSRMSGRAVLRLCAFLAVSVGALAGASVAGAGTVSVSLESPSNGTLVYQAAAGEANHVAVEMIDDPATWQATWQVTETGAPLIAGPGCTSLDEHHASCTAPPGPFAARSVALTLGDLDDWASSAKSCFLIESDLGEIEAFCFTTIDGGAGSDTVIGNESRWAEKVVLSGGEGDDVLRGVGDAALEGGPGADVLHGGIGDNTLDGGPGPDILVGGGHDTVRYADRVNRVFVSLNGRRDDGEAGEHDLVVDVDTVVTGSGADVIVGDSNRNRVDAGAGNDVVYAGGGNDTVYGDSTACDVFDSPGGADRIYGQAGDDRVIGCGGNDAIYGGLGRDSLGGMDGSDRLFGIDQPDTILGGLGNDTIGGGRGEDDLRGQEGNDTFYARDRQTDRIVGWTGTDRAQIDRGLDRRSSIERLF
jgi:Ca2+-binding RTX toxin-like protein